MNYFQHPYASNSALTKIAWNLTGRPEKDLSEYYRFGSLFDAVITEPQKLDLIQLQILGTEYTFTQREYDVTKLMRASFVSDEFCAGLLKTFDMQHEIYSELNLVHNGIKFGIKFKGKLDFFNKVLRMVVDLKSTAATSQSQFFAACEQFGYWRQMVAYMLLTGTDKAALVGVSKIKPYKVFSPLTDKRLIIRKGDEHWNIGLSQLSELAFKYWIIYN